MCLAGSHIFIASWIEKLSGLDLGYLRRDVFPVDVTNSLNKFGDTMFSDALYFICLHSFQARTLGM